MSKFFIAFVKITGWIPYQLIIRPRVFYEDKSNQSKKIEGPAIIISNHTSIFDFVVWLFTFFGRILRFQMAELLYDKKIIGKFVKWFGGIFVNRNSFDFGFMSKSIEILNAGGVVGIFPESRIPLPNEERPLKFKTSAAYLAMETGLPIIPVYTEGNYFQWRRNSVIIGKKIYASEFVKEGLDEKAQLEHVTEKLRLHIKGLGEKLQKEKKEATEKSPFYYALYDFAKITAAIPVLAYFRPKIIYTSDKAKEVNKKGVIYISNHVGYLDPIIFLMVTWKRRLHIMAAKEIIENRYMLSWVFEKFRCIIVDRENFKFSTFSEIEKLLKQGKAVGLFPEGSINTNEDKSTANAFKSGTILMAIRGDVPIVPICIKNRENWRKRQLVAIGESINIKEMCGPRPTMAEMDQVSKYLRLKEDELSKLLR